MVFSYGAEYKLSNPSPCVILSCTWKAHKGPATYKRLRGWKTQNAESRKIDWSLLPWYWPWVLANRGHSGWLGQKNAFEFVWTWHISSRGQLRLSWEHQNDRDWLTGSESGHQSVRGEVKRSVQKACWEGVRIQVWCGTFSINSWVWWHKGLGRWGRYPQWYHKEWPTSVAEAPPPLTSDHPGWFSFPQTSEKSWPAWSSPQPMVLSVHNPLEPEQKILRISMAALKYICLCLSPGFVFSSELFVL